MKDFYRYLNQGVLYAIILASVFSCMIEVPAPPKADFIHSLVTTGTATEATFTNNSVNASEFKWDFGNGVVSSEMSPKHTYNSGGNYNVKLVAKGDGGSHGISKVVSIQVADKPVAAFEWQPSRGGVIPSTVVFTNKSSGGKTFFWDFGNGSTSTEETPSRSYLAGQYVVTLTVKGDGGEHTTSKTIIIISATPTVAAFDISGGDCKAPCTVSFVNRSSPQTTEYSWDLGNGNASTQKDPTNEYKNPGTFNIKLTAKGPHGTNTVTQIVTIYEPYQPIMVTVEGGSFQMGGSEGEERERPVHTVRINNFSIGKYPVTSEEYRQFCAETGHRYPPTNYPDNYPVVDVSWNDAKSYCAWLSKKTGTVFRLPTEAEREFAARGGKKSQGHLFAGGNNLDEVGWFEDNSGKVLRGVGLKKANELGIYDMSGNVWDWCSDWFQADYYAISSADNPDGPASGSFKVLRGGSFIFTAYGCRVAFRDAQKPDGGYGNVGFRVVSSK